MMGWVALSAAMGFTSDCVLQKHLNLFKRPITVFFSLLSSVVLIAAFDNPLQIAKGCIFFQLLILAAYIDLKTLQIPNLIVFLVAVCGLIDLHPLTSLQGAAMMFLILLGDFLISGAIGGGDVKLLTACGFVLGIYGACQAGFLSMAISCAYTLAHHKTLKVKQPLGPFICIGCGIAYILSN